MPTKDDSAPKPLSQSSVASFVFRHTPTRHNHYRIRCPEVH
jgi:hypothetical protein